jgi:hypothetical protein
MAMMVGKEVGCPADVTGADSQAPAGRGAVGLAVEHTRRPRSLCIGFGLVAVGFGFGANLGSARGKWLAVYLEV